MIGKQYAKWYTSYPFDIGQATETSIKTLSYANKTAEDAIERANTFNSQTKSNGSLMRSMPHAVFGANMVKAGKFQDLKIYIYIYCVANYWKATCINMASGGTSFQVLGNCPLSLSTDRNISR